MNFWIFVNFLLIFTLSLLLKQIQNSAAPASQCQVSLIQTFSMSGQLNPQIINLEMCPTVMSSCCPYQDQIQIFKTWVDSGDLETLKQNFWTRFEVYSQLLDLLVRVESLSHIVFDKLKNEKVSNCKEISKRVKAFAIQMLKEKIEQNIQKMHKFLIESQQGIFCAVCELESQQYFNKSQQKATLSNGFCKNMITNSLESLHFFYSNINLYLNLVSRFLLSCDANGQFQEFVEIPLEVFFKEDSKIVKPLATCLENQEDSNMVYFCKDVCANFKFMQIPEYFFPQIQKLKIYNGFLQKNLDWLLNKGTDNEVAKDVNIGIGINSNKLSQQLGQIKVFNSLISDNYRLDNFLLDFQVQGVDLRLYGKTMILNKELLAQINQVAMSAGDDSKMLINPALVDASTSLASQIAPLSSATAGNQLGGMNATNNQTNDPLLKKAKSVTIYLVGFMSLYVIVF